MATVDSDMRNVRGPEGRRSSGEIGDEGDCWIEGSSGKSQGVGQRIELQANVTILRSLSSFGYSLQFPTHRFYLHYDSCLLVSVPW